ncbi:hypothetical protein GCM10010452_24840 [Crossiella cryophila]
MTQLMEIRAQSATRITGTLPSLRTGIRTPLWHKAFALIAGSLVKIVAVNQPGVVRTKSLDRPGLPAKDEAE